MTTDLDRFFVVNQNIWTEEEWRKILEDRDIFWFHDGNPRRPVAELTSGKYSSGFFNGGKLIHRLPLYSDLAYHDLAFKLPLEELHGNRPPPLDGLTDITVLAPEEGAVGLSQGVAKWISQPWDWIKIEKREDGSKKASLRDRFPLNPGDKVLPGEDTITTASTLDVCFDIFEERELDVLPYIFCLCNRSGMTEFRGCKIIALLEEYMPMWDPTDPPKEFFEWSAGAVKAKDNWDLLTKDYPIG